MDWYRRDVEELSSEDCWELLEATGVARLAVVVDERPEIFPVNYVVDRGTVVFRSGLGTKVSGALADRPVALEIDGRDRSAAKAWSVVVKGRGEAVPPGHQLMEALQLPLFPWQEGIKDRFLRVVPEEVSGRRFTLAPREAWNSPVSPELRTATGPIRRVAEEPGRD